MNKPEYTETVGVNEVVRKPPAFENTQDPEAMARAEGQMIGRIGEKKHSWFVIVMMWMALPLPLTAMTVYFIFDPHNSFKTIGSWLVLAILLLITGLLNLPIVIAIRTKIRS